ncbi:MAG: hypothetical protein ACYTBJ_04355 [Planctomycetota bacterium]|jgi:hypothetical protein
MEAILTIIAVAALVPIAIAMMLFAQVRLMAKAALAPSPDTDAPDHLRQWAADNDFGFVGSFKMKIGSMNAFIFAWRHSQRPTFFCQYLIRSAKAVNTAFDMVTLFDSDIMPTTASKSDGQLFPMPAGCYCQSFSNTSLDDQWYKHIETENFLIDEGGARLVQLDVTFQDSFTNTIRKQTQHIRSIPLWPCRAPYWFFVRKNLTHNKSVRLQHQKGMIKLPNELAPGDRITPFSYNEHS